MGRHRPGLLLRTALTLAVGLSLGAGTAPRAGAVTVTDAMGRAVHLSAPARRIVSLAPHATELLFAAGAGERVVGTARFSDYPPAAAGLPRIGDAQHLDLERVVALAPDLIVAWHSSLPAVTQARLQALGPALYISEPRGLADIAADIRALGRLAGTAAAADAAADDYMRRLDALRQRYAHRPRVRVFMQLWDNPVMTVGGSHFLTRVIELCGGRNVFAALSALAPAVSPEAVIAADPQAMVAGRGKGEPRDPFARWRPWTSVAAVQGRHLFTLPADLISRPVPRLLDGAARLCRDLDKVRADTAG